MCSQLELAVMAFRGQPVCAEVLAKTLAQKVVATLPRHCGVGPGDGLLIGVSGGPSSAFLARSVSGKICAGNARAAQMLRHTAVESAARSAEAAVDSSGTRSAGEAGSDESGSGGGGSGSGSAPTDAAVAGGNEAPSAEGQALPGTAFDTWLDGAACAPLPDMRRLCSEMSAIARPMAAVACFVDPRALGPAVEAHVLPRLPKTGLASAAAAAAGGAAAAEASPFARACSAAASAASSASDLHFVRLPLECAFVEDLTPWLPAMEMAPPDELHSAASTAARATEPDLSAERAALLDLVMTKLRSAEARDAAVAALTLRLLRRAARCLGLGFVALGTPADTAAEAVMAGAASGTGRSLPLAAAFRDERFLVTARPPPQGAGAEAVRPAAAEGAVGASPAGSPPAASPGSDSAAGGPSPRARPAGVVIVRPMLGCLRRETAIACRLGGRFLGRAPAAAAKNGDDGPGVAESPGDAAAPVRGRLSNALWCAKGSADPIVTAELPRFSTAAPMTMATPAIARQHGGVTLLAQRLVADLQSRFPSTSLTVVRGMQRANASLLPGAVAAPGRGGPAASAAAAVAASGRAGAGGGDSQGPEARLCPVCLGVCEEDDEEAEAAGPAVGLAAAMPTPAARRRGDARGGSVLDSACYACRVVMADGLADGGPAATADAMAALEAAWPKDARAEARTPAGHEL